MTLVLYVFAALQLLAAGLLVFGSSALRHKDTGGWFPGLFPALMTLLALAGLALGVWTLATAISLSRRSPWARLSAMGLMLFLLVTGVAIAFFLHSLLIFVLVGVLLAGLGALLAWQLNEPASKAWFARDDDQAAA